MVYYIEHCFYMLLYKISTKRLQLTDGPAEKKKKYKMRFWDAQQYKKRYFSRFFL